MRDAVRGTDCEGSVQHAGDESKSVGPASAILPVAPDGGIRGVAGASGRGHDRAGHDGHEDACEDEE